MTSKENNQADSWIHTLDADIQATHKQERINSGWSHVDAWNADAYICRVIGEICEHYLQGGVSTPSVYTEKEWQNILKKIHRPLISYSRKGGDDKRYEKAQEALRLFVDNLGCFWT